MAHMFTPNRPENPNANDNNPDIPLFNPIPADAPSVEPPNALAVDTVQENTPVELPATAPATEKSRSKRGRSSKDASAKPKTSGRKPSVEKEVTTIHFDSPTLHRLRIMHVMNKMSLSDIVNECCDDNIVLLLDTCNDFGGLARFGDIKNAKVLSTAYGKEPLLAHAKRQPSKFYIIERDITVKKSKYLIHSIYFAYEMEKRLADSHHDLAHVYVVCNSDHLSAGTLQNYYSTIKIEGDVSAEELICSRCLVESMYNKVYYAEQIAEESRNREIAATQRAEQAEEQLRLYKAQPWWRRMFISEKIEG